LDEPEYFEVVMFLKQNTAAEILVTLIDSADGKTLIEELTLGDITAAIYKCSTRSLLTLTAENFIYIADGIWKLILTAANLDTVGKLKITLRDDDVFLFVDKDFEVLPAAVYESKFDETTIRCMKAFMLGTWRPKTGASGTWQILDADDGETVVLEVTPSSTGRTVEVII
jgi:hypothetical protein